LQTRNAGRSEKVGIHPADAPPKQSAILNNLIPCQEPIQASGERLATGEKPQLDRRVNQHHHPALRL